MNYYPYTDSAAPVAAAECQSDHLDPVAASPAIVLADPAGLVLPVALSSSAE